jgi:orotidine-5'-phosphate decarboxylase
MDLPDPQEVMALARRLAPEGVRLKIGPRFVLAGGTSLVCELVAEGPEVFLDLKFHDIPAAVANAVHGAASLGVRWLTLHASGGREMMKQAVAAARECQGPRLLAVTVLTSLDPGDLSELGFARGPAEQVESLARMAVECGVDGLVCSPLEVGRLREVLGPEPYLVCPGVRPAGSEKGDQKRVATPADAVGAGADLLVVGRPVVRAADPMAAVREIVASLPDRG